MAANTYTVDNVATGNADPRVQSLLTDPGGAMKVNEAHIFAVACPKGMPAPVAGNVKLTQHIFEYLTFDGFIIAEDLMDHDVRWHIQRGRWTTPHGP